jgi:hypothetical protein
VSIGDHADPPALEVNIAGRMTVRLPCGVVAAPDFGVQRLHIDRGRGRRSCRQGPKLRRRTLFHARDLIGMDVELGKLELSSDRP